MATIAAMCFVNLAATHPALPPWEWVTNKVAQFARQNFSLFVMN
jgi:hypothetical protein